MKSRFPLSILAKALLASASLSLLLAGCSASSETEAPQVTPEQRQQAMKTDNSIPAPAQQRMNEQIADKQRMDELRARDAAQAPKSP